MINSKYTLALSQIKYFGSEDLEEEIKNVESEIELHEKNKQFDRSNDLRNYLELLYSEDEKRKNKMKINLKELKRIIKNLILEQSDAEDAYDIKSIKKYVKTHNIMQKDIGFADPNFEFEWEEAVRYKIFKVLGKEFYLERANNNSILLASNIKDKLSNTDLNEGEGAFDNLDEDKRERFYKALRRQIFERSIAIKLNDKRYDLMSGNTRLTGLAAIGLNQEICIIDLSDIIKSYADGSYRKNELYKNLNANKRKRFKIACEELIGLI